MALVVVFILWLVRMRLLLCVLGCFARVLGGLVAFTVTVLGVRWLPCFLVFVKFFPMLRYVLSVLCVWVDCLHGGGQVLFCGVAIICVVCPWGYCP